MGNTCPVSTDSTPDVATYELIESLLIPQESKPRDVILTMGIFTKMIAEDQLQEIVLVMFGREVESPRKVTLLRFARYTTPMSRVWAPGRNTSVVLVAKYLSVSLAISDKVWQSS